MKKQMNWKAMGFNSEKEYVRFLDDKKEQLMNRIISNPDLLNVFKRLKDK